MKTLRMWLAATALVSMCGVALAGVTVYRDTPNFTAGYQIAGTAVSSTEALYGDGVTAGTVTASKAVVVDANKRIDTIVIADSGLKLGTGTGTAVSATAAELNTVDVATPGTAEASKAAVLDANKGLSGLGIVQIGNVRLVNGATISAADPNPSRASLRAANFFLVDTTANAVDVDFSDDADLEAADLGTTWKFIVSAGGTNALTVTNGGSGVVVTTLNTLGTSCEDVGDSITCTAYALEAIVCNTVCADS